MERETLNAVIAELGPLDDGIHEIQRDEATGSWLIRFDDVVVVIEHNPSMETIRMWAEVGLLAEHRRDELMEGLLVYNGAAASTGGVTMAMAGPGGTVIQSVILPTAGLTSKSLVRILVNFATKTILWRGVLAGQAAPSPAATTDTSDFIAFRV